MAAHRLEKPAGGTGGRPKRLVGYVRLWEFCPSRDVFSLFQAVIPAVEKILIAKHFDLVYPIRIDACDEEKTTIRGLFFRPGIPLNLYGLFKASAFHVFSLYGSGSSAQASTSTVAVGMQGFLNSWPSKSVIQTNG